MDGCNHGGLGRSDRILKMSLLLAQLSSGPTIFSHTAGGGVQTGGSAAITRTFATSSSGGVSTAGSASVTRTFTFSASGGIQTAGTATVSLVSAGTTYSVTSSGGITTDGTATATFTPAPIVETPSRAGGGGGGFLFMPTRTRAKQSRMFSHSGSVTFSVYGWNDGEFVPSPANVEEEEILAAFLNS